MDPGLDLGPPPLIQSPPMGDWFRSVTVLALAFVGAVVMTIGLANVIVPGGAADPQAATGGDDGHASPAASVAPITGIGGNLAVTGDREGTLAVTREANEGVYSLVGDAARIVFQGSRPPVISQMSWEGLEFFPEPDACTITPGELDDEIGVGYAEIRCEGLADIRGGETVSVAGTLGLALTTLGESDLPQMGGSVAVGEETWTFAEAFLFQFPVSQGPGTADYNMVLADERGGSLLFRYDVQTHRLTLVNVERGGEASDLGPGACTLQADELGRLQPGTAVVELAIDCPGAQVPGLGAVPISGTLIVQQFEEIP
jgi:hypothetical protein